MIHNKRWRWLTLVIVLTAFLVGFGSGPSNVQALSLGGALKGALKIFGIAFVVKQFGGEINSFINGVLSQHSAKIAGQTKVVPIVRIGAGGTAVPTRPKSRALEESASQPTSSSLCDDY